MSSLTNELQQHTDPLNIKITPKLLLKLNNLKNTTY